MARQTTYDELVQRLSYSRPIGANVIDYALNDLVESGSILDLIPNESDLCYTLCSSENSATDDGNDFSHTIGSIELLRCGLGQKFRTGDMHWKVMEIYIP